MSDSSASENQHRDQRQLRHLVQIDAAGEVFALPIAEKTGASDRPRVLIFPKAGGCTVVPGLTISALLTPMPDEPGVARMAAVYDRLRKLDLDIGGDGLPIDMLEAAVLEVEGLVHDIRPDLANWDRDIKRAEAETGEVRERIAEWQGRDQDPARSTIAMLGEVLDQAERWRREAEAARRGEADQQARAQALVEAEAELQTIAERVGPAIGEAQIAAQDRKYGETARAVRTLAERFANLRVQSEAWEQVARGADRTIDGMSPLAEENARLRAELEAALADAEKLRAEDRAQEAAQKYRAEIGKRVDSIPGVIRIHWPEGVPLRAMVAEGTSNEDQHAVHDMIKSAVEDPDLQFIVEPEPGLPPEGWAVWPGTRPGDPGEGWLYGPGEHDDQDSLQDADAMGREDTEADAVDRTWELAAEDQGDGNRPGEDD